MPGGEVWGGNFDERNFLLRYLAHTERNDWCSLFPTALLWAMELLKGRWFCDVSRNSVTVGYGIEGKGTGLRMQSQQRCCGAMGFEAYLQGQQYR